jgi:hypothetical protein
MLKIETNQIKAAMECVVTEKNDPRFYLRGVLLEITACGDVHLVSTDGARLFFGRIPAAKVQWTDGRIEGHAQIILPYDALKKAWLSVIAGMIPTRLTAWNAKRLKGISRTGARWQKLDSKPSRQNAPRWIGV